MTTLVSSCKKVYSSLYDVIYGGTSIEEIREATLKNDVDAVAQLLPQVISLDDYEFSVLDAVTFNRPQILDVILQRANPKTHINNRNGYLLYRAAFLGHVEVVRMLLSYGANPNLDSLPWAASAGHVDVITVLLDAGANVHEKNDLALCVAIQNCCFDAVKLLLERGANIHASDTTGEYQAEKAGRMDVVLLIREKLSSNAMN